MKRLTLLCVCMATIGLGGCETKPYDISVGYQIYIVAPPINNYAIQEHKPLPVTCQPGTTISMMACRGEYEPASFVVETGSTLTNLIVTVGQLSGSSGTIPSSAVDIRVVQPCWLRITDDPGRMNWVLLHDPSLLKIVYEANEGSLSSQGMSFTRTPIDTSTLQPADVNSRQQFWLTVHVPKDAAAGKYAGTISVTAANAPTQTLTLILTVPGFDLAEPNFEYSIYHATGYGWVSNIYHATGPSDDLMRLNEFNNMVAHGCMNPNIYDAGVDLAADGKTLNFTNFAKLLSLREKAGMPKRSLYIVSGTPIHAGSGGGHPFPQVTAWVKEIVTWAHRRGYPDVYFMGNDEATGEGLIAQRPTWDAVHAGGGKIFAANYGGFFPHVGDIMDLAVIPSGNPIDWSSNHPTDWASMAPASGTNAIPTPDEWLELVPTMPWILDPIDWILNPFDSAAKMLFSKIQTGRPNYPVLIQDVHDNGFKIFTYMDAVGGRPVPEVHRRLRGLGLYKANLDGTMTWSYNHFRTPDNLTAGPVNWWNMHGFVLRGAEAPFDTLSWEAYREGYDDARYLATLQNAITQCRTTGRRLGLITGVETWLDNLPTDIDLDSWRREMAIRTEKLMGLKATVTPPKAQR